MSAEGSAVPAEAADAAAGAAAPAAFDEVINPGTRLSIIALLAATAWAEFSFIRERLGLSDSALSKQLAALEEAGYAATERRLVDGRRRMRVRLTALGREALDRYVEMLRAVVDAAPEAPAAGGAGVGAD